MYMKKALLGSLHGSAKPGQGIRLSATNEALNRMVCTFRCDRDSESAHRGMGNVEEGSEGGGVPVSMWPISIMCSLWVGLKALAKCMGYISGVHT